MTDPLRGCQDQVSCLLQSAVVFPNSPDLNPLDYVWNVVERVTNKSRHPKETSLRTAIEAAFADIDSATLYMYANASDRE